MNTVGRLLNILDYALYALRRKLLKNVSVFCLFTLVIFFLSSFLLVNKALTEAAQKILGACPKIGIFLQIEANLKKLPQAYG